MNKTHNVFFGLVALLLLAISPVNPATSYAQETSGLPVCGQTESPHAYGYFFSPDFQNDHVVFAAASLPEDDHYKLYRSEDGGETWRLNRDQVVLSVSFSKNYAQDHTLFTVGVTMEPYQASLLRSTDRGVTWERIAKSADKPGPGLGTPIEVLGPEVIYYPVGGMPGPYDPQTSGLFRATFGDAGVTIEQLANGKLNAVSVSPNFAEDQTLFISQYEYKINRGLRKSTDGGLTWARSDAGIDLNPALNGSALTDAVTFAPGAGTDSPLFVRSSQKYYRSMDAGATWQRVDALPEIWGAWPTDAKWVLSPYFAQDQTAWIEYGAWRTRDAGDTWQELRMAQVKDLAAREWCEGDRCGVLLLGGGAGWDDRAGVYKSFDLGRTWHCADAPTPAWWPDIPPVTPTWLPVVYR